VCNGSDAPVSDIFDDGPDDLYDGLFDPYDGLSDLSGADTVPDLEDADVPVATPPRAPALTGLIVGLLLVALSLATVKLIGGGNDDVAAPASTTSTTVQTADTGTPTGGDTTSTTTPADPGGGTTTPVEPGDGTITAVGEAIPIEELTLQTNGIGPIEFGISAEDAFGRLVASLGVPDDDTGPTASIGGYGICVGDTERIVQWGTFKAVAQGEGSDAKFVGYRLDLKFEGSADAAGSQLKTLSGLALSDRVSDLNRIYGSSFDLRKEVDPTTGATVFRLLSKSSGNLLLWGPLTSIADTGIVRGIYSPDVCKA
jgi:hypothetical protein